MPGWRIGFAAGNKTLIEALARVKSIWIMARLPHTGCGDRGIEWPQDCVEEMRSL